MFKYEWIWEKTRFSNQMLAKKQPLKIHENILSFYKNQPDYNPQGIIEVNKITKQGKNVTEILRYDKRKTEYIQTHTNYPKTIQLFNNETGLHPTQKPVKLFEYLIKTYTNENDIVLDNCAGSGTTGIACLNTNRNYILIEKEEEYVKIIKKRIKLEKERIRIEKSQLKFDFS